MNEETHPFTVIMGGKKISDKTLVIENLIEKCDKILSIPLFGEVNSLNASVALGISAYEVVRNRLQ